MQALIMWNVPQILGKAKNHFIIRKHSLRDFKSLLESFPPQSIDMSVLWHIWISITESLRAFITFCRGPWNFTKNSTRERWCLLRFFLIIRWLPEISFFTLWNYIINIKFLIHWMRLNVADFNFICIILRKKVKKLHFRKCLLKFPFEEKIVWEKKGQSFGILP